MPNKIVSIHTPRRYIYYSEHLQVLERVKKLESRVTQLEARPKNSVIHYKSKEDWFGPDYVELSLDDHFHQTIKRKRQLAEIIHKKHPDKSIKLILNRMSQARRTHPYQGGKSQI